MVAQTEMMARVGQPVSVPPDEEIPSWEDVQMAQRRGDNATQLLRQTREMVALAQDLLPRVESLEVRAELAEALGWPLVITPAEPDPGRDWSRVEAHLFNPNGKWKYQVWLDYSDEREELGVDLPGVSPAGWHFDGHEMAKRALYRATTNGTSGVTIHDLGEYWHLFVPNPPQGYPHWVRPGDPDERVGV
jgi:hypothetical protein